MHPNICPAIRNANMKGVLMSALHDIDFDELGGFDVRLGSNGDKAVLVVPGIIGSLNSDVLFAKVDTGFSVDDLPIQMLSIPVLDLEFSLNLIVPGVIYPQGYSGPLFIAVASRVPIRIPASYPLTQLIALNERESEIVVNDRFELSKKDQLFEGLLCPGWPQIQQHGRVVNARRCLELFREFSEETLSRTLRQPTVPMWRGDWK